MRLLTEDMPVPAVNIRALTAKAVPDSAESTNKKSVDEHEPVENRNLQLARQVDLHKSGLIELLSGYTMTALWLLEKYDSAYANGDNDDDIGSPTRMDEFVQPLRHIVSLILASQSNGEASRAKLDKLQSELTVALTQFPFVFEDLRQLVDLFIDAAGVVSASDLETSKLDAKAKDIIRKRIDTCNDNRRKQQLLNKTPSHKWQSHFDRALLPSTNALTSVMVDIILTEQSWLSVRQQLAVVNSKLVLFIANQYKGSFLDFEDLVQEGQSGLLKAVDRFKYQLGYQFSTYAGYWIRQAISRALSRSERVVRIPCGQVATINRVFKAKEELVQKFGKEPSVREIAEYVKMPEDEIHHILVISQGVTPFESFDDEDDDSSFAPIDFVEQSVYTHSSETIAEKQLNNLVNGAIKTLNAREAKIINAHFGMGTGDQKTLQQIGAELNLTRERVRQIQVVALNKIKMRYGEHLLSFL